MQRRNGLRAAFLAGAIPALLVATLAARTGTEDATALYAKNCSSCHGESGRGDGPSGLFLKRKPPDLRSAAGTLTDEQIFDRITAGKPPMPGFGRRLSEEERRVLVRYLRELAAAEH